MDSEKRQFSQAQTTSQAPDPGKSSGISRACLTPAGTECVGTIENDSCQREHWREPLVVEQQVEGYCFVSVTFKAPPTI